MIHGMQLHHCLISDEKRSFRKIIYFSFLVAGLFNRGKKLNIF